MQTANKSVKASATAFIESAGVTENTPFDLVAAMEEAFMNRPMFTPVHRQTTREQIMESVETVLSPMDEFVSNRILASARWKQKVMLFTNFGRWLEDDEKRIVNAAKEGLESVEDRLAAACYACDKIKSRKAWKLEQKRNEAASHHGERVKAGKVVVDGKASWQDAQVHELPPVSHGKAHEPAYYAIKLPDGNVVNLGKSVEGFAAKLNKYPSQALQNIAARLGIEMRGGDTAILNHLLGEEPIVSVNDKGETETNWKWLPSYTSVWQGTWIIYVGWRLNPKISSGDSHRVTVANEGSDPSIHWTSKHYVEKTEGGQKTPPYWVDADAQLTKTNPNRFINKDGTVGFLTPEHEDYQAPLTLSQLDYHLLSESSDLAVENEDGEVVEFMNEEEEFLTFAPQRESGETFIDFSVYAEDDKELALFYECSKSLERSEQGITLGDLESPQFAEHIQETLKEARERLAESSEQAAINGEFEPTQEDLENLATIRKLEALERHWDDFIGTRHDELMPKQATFGAKGDFREPPKVLPCMTVDPLNTIEAPLAREVEVMPEHAVVSYTWLDALSPRLMAKRELEARRGQVFKAVKDGTLKAQLAFSATFEQMLGLA